MHWKSRRARVHDVWVCVCKREEISRGSRVRQARRVRAELPFCGRSLFEGGALAVYVYRYSLFLFRAYVDEDARASCGRDVR